VVLSHGPDGRHDQRGILIGLLMGAISMNLPAIYLPAGPMLRGNWNGQPLGSGSDVWKYWAEKCAGNLSDEEWNEMEDGIARSAGHCMTMGTASTMASMVEALGIALPTNAAIPAVDFRVPSLAPALTPVRASAVRAPPVPHQGWGRRTCSPRR